MSFDDVMRVIDCNSDADASIKAIYVELLQGQRFNVTVNQDN